MLVATAALATTLLAAPQASAAPDQGGLHFGALQFDGAGADLPQTSAKLNAEYVDLHNNTRNPVQLRGYTAKTASGYRRHGVPEQEGPFLWIQVLPRSGRAGDS
ncbi:hypothetical protein ACGFX2_15755 [Streptomyces goshikiensis]|uniref:hypothetical protein n=1 Tax=Streptomyces goshikiensis TaxID=1942 RepID=UPI00371BD825